MVFTEKLCCASFSSKKAVFALVERCLKKNFASSEPGLRPWAQVWRHEDVMSYLNFDSQTANFEKNLETSMASGLESHRGSYWI